jgi:hypothetical protein
MDSLPGQLDDFTHAQACAIQEPQEGMVAPAAIGPGDWPANRS